MTHKAKLADVEVSGAKGAKLSLEVPDGLGKRSAWSGAGVPGAKESDGFFSMMQVGLSFKNPNQLMFFLAQSPILPSPFT